MTRLLPLDLHAHVDASIAPRDLDDLHAVVFAATRSLDEAAEALKRDDSHTIWGVGCHPGLVGAHKKFSPQVFEDLVSESAYIAELGLDGDSRVPMTRQTETLQAVLDILQSTPRIVSLHSYRAAEHIIDEVQRHQVKGVILHWWLGDEHLTRRAVDLGCYFSVNVSSVRQHGTLDAIPLDRVLTETDHPFGDRWGTQPRQPGNVTDVERILAGRHGLDASELRRRLWRNLSELVRHVGCARLLPRSVRASLAISAD